MRWDRGIFNGSTGMKEEYGKVMEHDEKHYFNFTLTVYGDFSTFFVAQYGKEYSNYVKFRPPVPNFISLQDDPPWPQLVGRGQDPGG